MSLKNVTSPETNLREIEFNIEKDVFENAVTKVFKKNAAKMTVPGFRKGKAPRHIIEKMYGKGVFYEDAINEVLPEAYDEAVKESGLDIVGRPEFDIVSVEDGVTMKAKVYIKPEVTINNYKGLELTKTITPVTDEQIDAEIERVRDRNARQVEITDRAAEMGDIVNFDFDGYLDGAPFEGGKSESFDLTLGSGQFIPGFEEQVAGHKPGDDFDVNVTFPEDYHASELAGKEAVFKCKLNTIKFSEKPALDDEFAKDVSEFDTLDEYKADIKAKMEASSEREAEKKLDDQLMDALIANMEADIPPVMIDEEAENFLRDYDNRLKSQGLDLSTYLKYTGMTLDSMREQFRPMAQKQVSTRLALEKIVALENIEVSEEELETEYQKIADSYQGVTLEQVKSLIQADTLKKDVAVEKAVKLVKDAAKIKEEQAVVGETQDSPAKQEDAE
ncbi:MAG: trigger factor [Clostridiales bacterium]|nr:trigger factor [Clostridiales bacterium]